MDDKGFNKRMTKSQIIGAIALGGNLIAIAIVFHWALAVFIFGAIAGNNLEQFSRIRKQTVALIVGVKNATEDLNGKVKDLLANIRLKQ